MKRFLIACLLALVSVPALAQKTPAPFVLQAYYNNNGVPYSAAGMCVYAAGTSTLATSYTTAAGSVDNANPLLLNSAGRPDSNGFFLSPGVSYKLVLRDFTGVSVPSCSNGSVVWTQDNITAVPSSSGIIEVSTAIAGEAISAGDAVYLSDGGGSRTAGRWYRTDSDFTYASSEAPLVGVATSAISSGATGTVVIQGQITLAGPFSPGSRYWASATAGGLTATIPTNARQIGVAQSTTRFIVESGVTQLPSLGPAYIINAVAVANVAQGRLTLTTGVPVTVSDVTGATTVYYTPYHGSAIALYNTTSTVWQLYTFTELSIALGSDTTALPYDVFAYISSSAVAIERLAWTNTTTRATALTTQNGIYVKSGDASRRYLGTYYTTAAGQTTDNAVCRCLWNNYNRVRRPVRVFETTDSWTQPAANTWRQANAAAGNQISVIAGLQETTIHVTATGIASGGGATSSFTSIGLGSTTTPSTLATIAAVGAWSIYDTAIAEIVTMPTVGISTYVWLERVSNNTNVWYGDNGGSIAQAGMSGWYES